MFYQILLFYLNFNIICISKNDISANRTTIGMERNSDYDVLDVITVSAINNLTNRSVGRSPNFSYRSYSRTKRAYDDHIEVKSLTPDLRGAQVIFTSTGLTNSMIQIETECLNEWCKNERVKTICHPSISLCNITNLEPFTSYTANFKLCKSDTDCNTTIETKSFKTKAAAPSAVRNLTVYSKNETSISLKWKPPYPPRGKLISYDVLYVPLDGRDDNKQQKNVNVTTCDIWPELHCFTIFELNSEHYYRIIVRAINENVDDLGQLTSVKAITRKESSQPPSDFNITWSLENHLNLTWKYPPVSNGDITFFNITLIPRNHYTGANIIYKNITVNKQVPQYHYTICARELLTSLEYEIKVSAYNGLQGKELVLNDTSPPSTPCLNYEPILNIVNKTIVANISLNLEFDKNNFHNYRLFLFVKNGNNLNRFSPDLPNSLESFKLDLPGFQLLYDCKFKNHTILLSDVTNCDKLKNFSVNSNLFYNVTIILTNTFKNKTRLKIYSYTVGEPIEESFSLTLLIFISLSVVVTILFLLIIILCLCRRKLSNNNTIESRYKYDASFEDEKSQERLIPSNNTYSKLIKLSELEQYVRKSLKNRELERQFNIFPPGQTRSWIHGASLENKRKNRYANLYAYDHTRVILRKLNKIDNSDYINANYIDSYEIPKAYIATQAPKLFTVLDFWKMIWQENVRHIFILANVYPGEKKYYKYWPDPNKYICFDDITIQYVSNQVFNVYEYRIFNVTHADQSRTIKQYHFLHWPNYIVHLHPQTLVPFLEQLHCLPLSSDSPIVVHCDGGVGRTGIFLLCDICLRMTDKEKAVDVLKYFQKLRDQRPKMISNVQQYQLAHMIILDYIFHRGTGIPCKNVESEVNKLIANKFSSQIQYLKRTEWKDQFIKSLANNGDPLVIDNKKNRFPNIVPDVQNCVRLSPYPPTDNTSVYINAINVDRFKIRDKFIVTQQPLPNTVVDFWRLVYEKEVTVVLSLNQIDQQVPDSCVFWPI